MKLNPALGCLSCFACGAEHDAGRLQGTCSSCRMPLRVDYELEGFEIDTSTGSLWRYRRVLPIVDGEVSLGEGWTPLRQVEEGVWVKDESGNPTGSFKARGMSVAVSMARALGAEALAAPSAGNAAGALAAYGAAAGLSVLVAMPEDTPAAFVEECRHYGAEVHLVAGTIAEAAAWLREHGPRRAVDLSTMREPYRLEGKKTMAYELFEQFDGRLPEVIVYPTGGGTGLVGMWKAFSEMERLGWIGAERPRLVSVQAAGCAPVVRAFERGDEDVHPWKRPRTSALGLRVPAPIGGFLCLRSLRDTKGTAVAVAEAEIGAAVRELVAMGIDACPEAGAAWAGTRPLRQEGWIGAAERVVVFNTGSGLKYR
ncbi:MAG: threonine synthase [Acidimicrobiia bacterium]